LQTNKKRRLEFKRFHKPKTLINNPFLLFSGGEMAFTAIETIALVLIVVSVIKILVLLVNPKSWMNFAKGVYKNPDAVKVVSFILAAIVLWYLVQSGITIVQILAVTVFVALLFLIGLATEFNAFVKKSEALIKRGKLWQEYWFYTLIWIALLIWAIKELFM